MKINFKLKKLIYEVINESGELALTDITQLVDKSHAVEEFMKKLVGKKLKDLLDAASFSRLYIMNKYGIGSKSDETDVQVLVNNMLNVVTVFINNRLLEPIGKQRAEFEKQIYGTSEYKDWHVKRNAAFKSLFAARRSGNEDEINKAQKHYDDVMATDPSFDDYKKMMDDMKNVVQQFQDKSLKLHDVLPGPDDTEQDKKNWQAVKNAFDELKKININETISLKNLLKKIINEMSSKQNNYPPATVQLFTDGNKSTMLLLYKGDIRNTESYADVSFKSSYQFDYLVSTLQQRSVGADEDVKSILRNLTPTELKMLKINKMIVTTNIPNEILDLTGRNLG